MITTLYKGYQPPLSVTFGRRNHGYSSEQKAAIKGDVLALARTSPTTPAQGIEAHTILVENFNPSTSYYLITVRPAIDYGTKRSGPDRVNALFETLILAFQFTGLRPQAEILEAQEKILALPEGALNGFLKVLVSQDRPAKQRAKALCDELAENQGEIIDIRGGYFTALSKAFEASIRGR